MADPKKGLEGTWDKIKGKVKEVTGGATGDRGLQGEGKFDQVKGKVKDFAESHREEIKNKIDDLTERGKEKLEDFKKDR
jgi:uncharacterized protein YjbJ (UPF0337 family)